MEKWLAIFGLSIFFTCMQVIDVNAEEIVQTDETYTYTTMQEDLKKLRTKYKGLLKIEAIGRSHFNREIIAIKLGNGRKNILIHGSHHGREWMTSLLLMKMLEEYGEAFTKNRDIGAYPSSILNEVSLWFVPMVNPDGVTLQQFGVQEFPVFHRKQIIGMNGGSLDFQRWKANGWGVDLNRQYPAGWEELEVSSKRNYQYYKGNKPLQAREALIMTRFTRRVKPEAALAYHSAGREIYWHYRNGQWLERDRRLAAKAASITGYKLNIPPAKSTGGGFTDWFITTFHKPAMTIEISYLVGESNPPLTVFPEEWSRNRELAIMLAHELQ